MNEEINFRIDVEKRITKLETEMQVLKHDVVALDSINDAVTRLVTLQECQLDLNKKFDESLVKIDISFQEQTKTNIKVANTLELIEKNQQETNKEVRKLDGEISDIKEKINDSEEKNIIKIDTRELIKKITLKLLIPIGGVAGFIYAILSFFKLL